MILTVSAFGLLLDGEDHSRLGVESCVAALGAGGIINVCHLAQRRDLAVAIGDDEVFQILDFRGAGDVADQVLARLEIDESAARVGAELLNGLLDCIEADVQRRHFARIWNDAVLANLAADWNDLRDAATVKQLRAAR